MKFSSFAIRASCGLLTVFMDKWSHAVVGPALEGVQQETADGGRPGANTHCTTQHGHLSPLLRAAWRQSGDVGL